MTDAQLRDGPWAGMSRLYKIIAIILALILAITWWLGRGADSRFGCLPGASSGAVSGIAAAPPPSPVVSTPPVAAAAPTTPPAAAATTPAAAAEPVTAAPAAGANASSAAATTAAATATEAAAATAATAAAATTASPNTGSSSPAAAASAATTASTASSDASAKALSAPDKDLPTAKVHFAVDKAKLWSGANKEMAGVIAYLKANPRSSAVLSGFHDPSGNREYNIELAKNRSHAVRDRLLELGIDRGRIIEEKPVETTGDGTPAEARRVEISIRP